MRPSPKHGDWSVYILRCGDGSLYTGITNDLARRVETHQKGRGAAYTRSRLPVRLVFTEPALDRSQALRREAGIKKLERAEKLLLVKRALRPARKSGQRRRATAGTVRGR